MAAEQPAGAYVHTSGPIELYCQFRDSASWLFIGTALQAPEPEENPMFIEVFNDYGGRSVPFQLIYDGETCLVPVILNRVDLAVCRRLRDVGARSGAPTLGADDQLARGSLVLGGKDFALVLKNNYFGTTNATPGLPASRLYHSAVVASYKESTVGTRALDLAIVFKCNSIFLGPKLGFKLYSDNTVDFGVLTPN